MTIENTSKLATQISHSGEITGQNLPWKNVLHLAQRITYSKGTIIPHTENDTFYYLDKGEVVISYISYEGLERLMLFINGGCLFNEARSVSQFKPIGQFKCTTDVTLYAFKKTLLTDPKFIRENPELIVNLIKSMGTKILIHYNYLAEMGVGTPVALLSRLILDLINKNDGQHEFALNMTQQNVANLLGVHRTTLARAIQQLQSSGAIEQCTSKKVIILDEDKLFELAYG